MTKRLPTAILIGAATCASAAAHGQSLDYAALEALFGEPVTTSVTGSPQRVSDVPATMEIVTAEDIRRSGARDIPGALRHVAGIDVQRWTNDQADVAVRGYNQAFSPRLLVLIDGRQVYADYYGFTPWSTLPIELEAIRQIEIVKGPSSALFGFNAVGGVINIITRNPLHEDMRTLSVAGGTQDLRQASAVSSWRFGDKAALRVSAGSRRTDDFSTPQQVTDLGTRRGNDRDALSVDSRFALSDKLQFGVEATYSAVAQAEIPPLYSMSYTDYTTRSLRTTWSADTRIGLVQASLYRNVIDADAFLADDPAPLLQFDNEVTVAQVQNIFKVGTDHVLRVSAEYRENGMDTTPVTGARIFYDIATVGAMWHWTITPALSLTNAVRVDDWSLGRSGFFPAEIEQQWGFTEASWDRSERGTSFNTGLVWNAGDAGTFRLAVGRGRQLPNLLNLGGNLFEFFGFWFAGVPILDPAVVTSHEINWTRTAPSSGIELRVGVFHTETRDVLAQFFNLGSSRITGAELSLTGEIGERWRWGASYTPQRVSDRFPDELPLDFSFVDFENTTPRHVVKGNFGWAHGPWEIDAYLRHQSGTHSIRGDPVMFLASLVPVPGHLAADGRVAYALGERSNISIAGENLTRSSQRQTSGPEVERRVLATFTIGF